jgi:hypothetical protein
MGARLELKFGLVADADRIANSADTMLVEEPVIGSKSRTKGNLYLVVSSAKAGGRAREATMLVADTIRREYYYDESAGIPICLEKAVRAANRKLRGSREGAGLPAGALGIAIAIVRQSELYVASIGEADAYLVRAARLLMPDQTLTPGLPADDALRVDVWRGELAVGDSLLLVSRHLTEVVGTEELKNAVVTLHPQSAVEHLHHLFVAAGGDGSDAVIALEATELAASRSDRRPVPEPGLVDPYGDLPRGPIPGGDSVAGAAGAVTGAVSGAAGAVGGAFSGIVDRILDLMPRRRPSPRRVASTVSRRESQRRAALALLGLLGVVIVLGVAISVFPRGTEDPVVSLSSGERAFLEAQDGARKGVNLVATDPEKAGQLCHDAWEALGRAREGGVPGDTLAPLESEITGCLDGLYLTKHPRAQLVYDTSDMEPRTMVQGPDRNAYLVDDDSRSVWRIEPRSGDGEPVIRNGDGPGRTGVGIPRLVSTGGVDLVVLDDRGTTWRWRTAGSGTLSQLRKPDDPALGDDIPAMETYLTDADQNVYYLYVIDPSESQIHRYSPTLDGGGFASVGPYLATDKEDVGAFRDLTIVEGYLYTLTSEGLVRHYQGAVRDFDLDTPPDDDDLRPGHDYRLVTALGERLYVYDAKWSRVLVFELGSGAYLEQWLTTGSVPRMEDLRGMYLVAGAKEDSPPELFWLSPRGLYRSPLVNDPRGGVIATPAAEPEGSDAPERTPRPRRSRAP